MLSEAGRLLLELLVVFVGVYAAFALSTWQEDRRDDARRAQILEALHAHVAWVDEGVDVMRPALDSSFISPFLDGLEAGERPEVEPITLTTGESGTGLWEAMLQSGGLDVLEAPTIELMHKYFASLQRGADGLEEARAQTLAQLYPRLGSGPDTFYDPRTGALRPEYGWYPAALRRMRSDFNTVAYLGDVVLVHLDSLLGRPPTDSLAASR